MKKLLLILGISIIFIIIISQIYYKNIPMTAYLIEQEKSAKQGDPKSQALLGFKYFAENNYELAIKWFEKAANQGLATAQLQLGDMYANGQGVQQNYIIACQWYMKAANQGEQEAQYALGNIYSSEKIGYKDINKARQWYEKAAEQGHVKAQLNLGFIYDGQDLSKARYWYEKAANQGDPNAQIILGLIYEFGHGVRQNYTIAKEWYGKACDKGEQRGCEGYARLNTVK